MALQSTDYSGLSDTSLGTSLPNIGSQVTDTFWPTAETENRPYIHSGGWTLNPITTGKKLAAYHQWNAGARITKVVLKFRFTDTGKVAVDSGAVIGIYGGQITATATGLNLPAVIACHFGVSMTQWHIDIPFFIFGLAPVAKGTFKTQLTWNTDYYMMLEFIAADTIKLTLPDGSVPAPIKHPNFNQATATWAFTEVFINSAINESNTKIILEQFDTTQWMGLTTPPAAPVPAAVAEYYEPFCRNEGLYLPRASAKADAITTATAHVNNNNGHVVVINDIIAG